MELSIAARAAGSQFSSGQVKGHWLTWGQRPHTPNIIKRLSRFAGKRAPAEGDTRLIEHRNLLFLRAALYPIDGTAELAIAVREAGSQFASQYMLSRFLRALHAPPEAGLSAGKYSPILCPPGKLLSPQFHSL